MKAINCNIAVIALKRQLLTEKTVLGLFFMFLYFVYSVLIWLGDLNYRIDRMVPDMVKECIKLKHFQPLRENDQVCQN